MKEYDAHRLYCRLDEILRERRMTGIELHRLSGVARETITQLRNNTFVGVSSRTIARICGVLCITPNELFVVIREDIWLPIRRAKEVTIHVGSRTWNEPHPARPGMPPMVGRQFVGRWDFRAFKQISEYLIGLNLGIKVHFQDHTTDPGQGVDAGMRAAAQAVFSGGNHIILGSPIASAFTELVVCSAYRVSPFSPKNRTSFPYAFEWDDWRQVRSSIGRKGAGESFGVAEMPSNRIVAPHVIVPAGSEGTDGALIVVYRVLHVSETQKVDDESVVICLLGDSGLGTFAAAQVAIDPQFATELYPALRKTPRMRAVKCRYGREPGDPLNDNREVRQVELVPERRTAGATRAVPVRPSAALGTARALR